MMCVSYGEGRHIVFSTDPFAVGVSVGVDVVVRLSCLHNIL